MNREHLLMSGTIDRIKSDFAHALIRRCSERGCTLSLGGLSNRVVLKGEKIRQDRKMCDCIIFIVNGPVVIGIVELKSRTVHASEIAEKLANSSEIALDILKECIGERVRLEFEFYHLLLYKKLASSEAKEIKRKEIRVRGRGERYGIRTERCGFSFSKVIH